MCTKWTGPGWRMAVCRLLPPTFPWLSPSPRIFQSYKAILDTKTTQAHLDMVLWVTGVWGIAWLSLFWAALNFSCGFLCSNVSRLQEIDGFALMQLGLLSLVLLANFLALTPQSCPEISCASSRHRTSVPQLLIIRIQRYLRPQSFVSRCLAMPRMDPLTWPAPISRWFSIAPMHGSCYCRQEPWMKILGNQNARHLQHTGLFPTETCFMFKPSRIWL